MIELDLNGLFLADLIPGARERFERSVQLDVIKEGRAAYLCGIPYEGVPPFINQNMEIAWSCGWRWRRTNKRRKKKGNLMLIVKQNLGRPEEVFEAGEIRYMNESHQVFIAGTAMGLKVLQTGTVLVLTQMGVEIASYFLAGDDADEDRDPADADGGDPGGKPAGPAH
jgi:hypothetical protein